jgi:hypothetical protein
MDLQHPPPDDRISDFFASTVALSDEYLAIATNRNVMIFKASGRQVGRLLVCDKIRQIRITRVMFSADGSFELDGSPRICSNLSDIRVCADQGTIEGHKFRSFGAQPGSSLVVILRLKTKLHGLLVERRYGGYCESYESER